MKDCNICVPFECFQASQIVMWQSKQKKLLVKLLAMAKDLKKSNKFVCGLVTVTAITHDFQLHCLFCAEVIDDFVEFNEHINTKHRRNHTSSKPGFENRTNPDNSTKNHQSLIERESNDSVYSYGTTFIDFLNKEREAVKIASTTDESEKDVSVYVEHDFESEKMFTKDGDDELVTEFEGEQEFVSGKEFFVKVEEYFESEVEEETTNELNGQEWNTEEFSTLENSYEIQVNDLPEFQKLTTQYNVEDTFDSESDVKANQNYRSYNNKEPCKKASSDCGSGSENDLEHNNEKFLEEKNNVDDFSISENSNEVQINDPAEFQELTTQNYFEKPSDSESNEYVNRMHKSYHNKNSCEEVSSDVESNSENGEHSNDRKFTKFSIEEIEFLIDIYKEYPVLWDCQKSIHTSPQVKSKMYSEIAEAMQEKFKRKIAAKSVQSRIRWLRLQLRQELHSMVIENRKKPNLWFFYRISFVLKYERYGENLKLCQQFEENMPLNSDFINLFKSCSCLWDRQDTHYKNEERENEAHNFLIKSMKDKWNLDLSKELVLQKIAVLYFLYKESKSNDSVKTYEKPWYYEKLCFLGERRRRADKRQLSYVCEMCHDKFGSEVRLKNHLFRVHEIKSFVCEICRKVFHNSASLKRHSNTHLSLEERPYACKTCGHRFADRVNCITHERRHKKDYSHSCEVCNRQFYTRNEVKIHMRTHTGEKAYVCDECGKAYRGLTQIINHRKRHLGLKLHKCDICTKSFFDSATLNDHRKSHSTIRDNICNICGKGFKFRKTLVQHKELHSDHKKYSCKICERSFAQHAGLHSHMKSHGI